MLQDLRSLTKVKVMSSIWHLSQRGPVGFYKLFFLTVLVSTSICMRVERSPLNVH